MPDDLLVCAPLRIEAWLLRRGNPALNVLRTGYGGHKARQAAEKLRRLPFGGLLVAGFGGALVPGLAPGDVVVARRVGRLGCPWAPAIAGVLSGAGFRVRIGEVATSDRLVDGHARARVAATGAVAVDLESAPLAAAAGGRPFGVVRVIVDTPDRSLFSLATLTGGRVAARTLAMLGPSFEEIRHQW